MRNELIDGVTRSVTTLALHLPDAGYERGTMSGIETSTELRT